MSVGRSFSKLPMVFFPLRFPPPHHTATHTHTHHTPLDIYMTATTELRRFAEG